MFAIIYDATVYRIRTQYRELSARVFAFFVDLAARVERIKSTRVSLRSNFSLRPVRIINHAMTAMGAR